MEVQSTEVRQHLQQLGYENMYDETELEELTREVSRRLAQEQLLQPSITTFRPVRAFTGPNTTNVTKTQDFTQKQPEQSSKRSTFGTFQDEDDEQEKQQAQVVQQPQDDDIFGQLAKVQQTQASLKRQQQELQHLYDTNAGQQSVDLNTLADRIVQSGPAPSGRSSRDMASRIANQKALHDKLEPDLHTRLGPQRLSRVEMIGRRADPVERNDYYKAVWKIQGAPEDRQKRKQQQQIDELYRELEAKKAYEKAQGIERLTKYQLAKSGRK